MRARQRFLEGSPSVLNAPYFLATPWGVVGAQKESRRNNISVLIVAITPFSFLVFLIVVIVA